MTMLDPADRIAVGLATEARSTARDPVQPTTLLEQSWRNFVWAEVWSRPGLPLRPRYIVAMASAATCGLEDRQVDDFVRGALVNDCLTLTELREAALHLAVYAGWGNGGKLDRAITRVANELGLAPVSIPPICPAPWDPQIRNSTGHAAFDKVMTFPPGPPNTPYFEGINNFVFGEMWGRPGLDEPARRWITLVGVCDSAAEIPIRTHIYAAIASGNCTGEEMLEFVLQYGTHAGWPKASRINAVVIEIIARVEKGLAWRD